MTQPHLPISEPINGNRRQRLRAALLLFAVAGLLTALYALGWLPVAPEIATAIRYAGLLGIGYYAFLQRNITVWIVAALFIGSEVGFDFPSVGIELNLLSKIFIKLIKTVIAPLLFSTLIIGIAGHSDMKSVGRMGLRALLYFEGVTTLALVIGLVAINLTQAGVGMVHENGNMAIRLANNIFRPLNIPPMVEKLEVMKPKTWQEIVLHIFPDNFIKSISEGEVLQIVVFCMMFAFALMLVSVERRRPILNFAHSLAEVMFKFTGFVMYLAPFAVGGAMAYTTAKLGVGAFSNLLLLLATLYAALFVFVFGVLLPIALVMRIDVRRFWRYASEPVSIAFGTSSSEAALPAAMDAMKRMGIPDEIVSFVLPTGLSFNLDGTTLYLALASMFVAQAAGMHLSISEQIVMMLTLMLTSKGVAGVSRASLVILAGTAASFGLPDWPILAIMGIDALMDMARTSVNMLGNCLATVVIAKWEGKYPANDAHLDTAL